MVEITPETLAEIETRAKAASPGPWTYGAVALRPRVDGWEVRDRDGHLVAELAHEDAADARFIEDAREDVPALIAEVRRLRDLCEEHRIDPARSPCPRCSSCGARTLVVWVLSANWLKPSPPEGDPTGVWVCDRELRERELAAKGDR